MNPSMKEIADKLNISINAVSIALNDKEGVSEQTRREVLETAEKIGYLDKKQKYRQVYSKNRLGLFVAKNNFTSRFYSRVISGIEQEASKQGYYVIIRFLEDEEAWTEDLNNRYFQGMMIIGIIEEDILRKISKYCIPMVLVDVKSYAGQYDTIVTQNRIGTYDSVSFLIENGFRTIGFFGDYEFSHSNRERFWGYMEALTSGLGSLQAAAKMSEKYSVTLQLDSLITARNVEAIKQLLIRNKDNTPEAYQCANDETAAVLCNSLKSLGYTIPQDVALIGFDDSDVGTIMLPKLTTLHVQRDRMGREALYRLIWRINHHNSPVTETALPVDFIIRDSTYRKRDKSNELK